MYLVAYWLHEGSHPHAEIKWALYFNLSHKAEPSSRTKFKCATFLRHMQCIIHIRMQI
uniref:Uncharacterized protein n=1 Tax=Arion vulgaris TaxID=1028688 RepID=A0A0B7B5D1_9EUPU